ncbi:O-antigen ligase family protein [Bradyrhizobium sp. G127]|uniref:O-antigen ligase family protein n=1 Tax=Bradyrhizobium sp. G127 TaxID=2904800 RepID=UPI001F1C7CA2|nr:O-antigen ligase family protein [Bradyrhizobium sp. G127]MCF2523863.1 O-antigen ligase domain-containing protein [Bradyrhizobium sp. G127]
MAFAAADYALPAAATPPGITAIQRLLMWGVGAGGAIVFIEPSPYELVTLVSVIFFFATGLRMRPVFLALLILLFLLNIGYTICSVYLMDKKEILNWILTSWYMAITSLFFAMVLSEDTASRLEFLRRGLIFGALIASLAAVAGYFHLVPGGYDLFTLYSRARGTFKDPNVLGAYLILPALFLLQTVVTQSFWKSVRSAVALGIVSLAVLLAFSRASWGQLVICSAFMLVLMYLTTPSQKQRTRIVTVAIAAAICAALLLVVLLSLDSVSNLFQERASFNQSYDTGRFGRFGRHALGFQMALELPLGIGPLQFTRFFPEDTHNSFLNAFMSGGWIAGIAFPALIFTTVVMGFKLIFVRVPWQRTYLAIFAAFVGTVGEAFIIDVDHWRHFWMMLGTMWAMFAAAHAYSYQARKHAAQVR